MPTAITRGISAALARCELTHIAREPIDTVRAAVQHAAYEHALAQLGFTLIRLPADDELPDSVFIEDTAIVLDTLAIVARPGAESRRAETAAVAEMLAEFLPVARIAPPGTLDGGDVLRLGSRLFVGRSRRTNDAAIEQVRGLLQRAGATVTPVPVTRCLHLKSAVTAVAPDTLLINPLWVERETFDGFRLIEIDPREPHAANALLAGDAVIYPRAFPWTADRLMANGLDVRRLDVSEIAKAEGGVTCCSILVS